MKQLTIEIWSDVVCPWCYIGKRRFESALAQFPDRDKVRLIMRSFELDPSSPQQTSGSLSEMLAHKMGVPVARAEEMNAHVTRLAAAEGLDYQLGSARHGNTFNAHRLIHLAAAHGLQAEATEQLFQAYFTRSLPIGDSDTLMTIGRALGLPEDELRALIDSDIYADDVRTDEQRAQALGISGVPFFVLNEQFGVSGAQTPEVFLRAIEHAWASAPHILTPLAESSGDDTSCADGSCALQNSKAAATH